jgi:NADPH2:quinone reductase
VAEVETPRPAPGEVLLAIKAGGVNFADLLMIAGQYQEKPAFPFSPGLEVAGDIAELGEGVEGLKPGQRVIGLMSHGGFAEFACLAASDVYPIPEAMSYEVAAGFPITYGTAHGGLVWRAALAPGEQLLVHGAAGGVGLAAVEVGKALGARILATAGGEKKLEIARRHGAEVTIDYRREDIRERVKAETGGRGVDVVFDPVGGDVFDASLRCTAWAGRILVIGFAGGRIPQIPANLLLVKNIAVIGLYWGAYRKREPERMRAQFDQLFAWFEEGRLKPHVSHRLPLDQAGEALTLLRERRSTGKVVLTTQ